jgi:hypothetical protein
MALTSFSARTAAGTIINFASNLFGGVHYSLKGLINAAGTIINPATQDTLAAVDAKMATLLTQTDGTEASLTTIAGAVTRVSSATLTNVASAATSTTIVAANANRRGLLILNDDANAVKIKYGATASATSYTVNIPGGGGYWEMPQPIYTGVIDGIWAADGGGSARVTEL